MAEQKEPIGIQRLTGSARACCRRGFLRHAVWTRSAHPQGASVQVPIVQMHLDARRELHDDGHAGRGLMQLPHQLHEGRRGDVGLVGVAEPVLGLVHPRKGDVEIRPDDPRQPFTGLGHVHLSPPNPPAPVRGRVSAAGCRLSRSLQRAGRVSPRCRCRGISTLPIRPSRARRSCSLSSSTNSLAILLITSSEKSSNGVAGASSWQAQTGTTGMA